MLVSLLVNYWITLNVLALALSLSQMSCWMLETGAKLWKWSYILPLTVSRRSFVYSLTRQ